MSESYYTRFPEVDLDTASEEQRRVAEEIKSGPRKAVIGPFIPLLHAPELARRIQKVGEYLRFESSLPKDILECAVITVARRWRSSFEWKIHSDLAAKAGVPVAVIAAIEWDADVQRVPAPYRLVIAFCRESLLTGDVGEEFREAQALYGYQGVLELLTICGYYSTLAMYLNTARITE
jgi:4-carboxymuconolactone decarboxylase